MFAGLTAAQKQLAQSFVEQGYSEEQAARKAKEVAPTPQQKRMQEARRARKDKK